MRRALACGPLRLFTTVGSPPPFALSLSKGQAELVFPMALSLSKGAFVPHAKGFLRQAQDDRKYRLSPNGDETGASIPQPERFFVDGEFRLWAASGHQHERGPHITGAGPRTR